MSDRLADSSNRVSGMSEQPYDYSEAKQAIQRASRERRDAEGHYLAQVKAKAHAERVYRSALARAILEEKTQHGSTVAEHVARGRPDVARAKEESAIAEGMERAALERMRLCSEDRSSLVQLVSWSRQIDPSIDAS